MDNSTLTTLHDLKAGNYANDEYIDHHMENLNFLNSIEPAHYVYLPLSNNITQGRPFFIHKNYLKRWLAIQSPESLYFKHPVSGKLLEIETYKKTIENIEELLARRVASSQNFVNQMARARAAAAAARARAAAAASRARAAATARASGEEAAAAARARAAAAAARAAAARAAAARAAARARARAAAAGP